jgi:hypothetical protein
MNTFEFEDQEPDFEVACGDDGAVAVEEHRVRTVRFHLTPWMRRLLAVAAAVNGTTTNTVLREQFESWDPTPMGNMHESLPVAFWDIAQAGESETTDTQIACAAHCYAFRSEMNHPWETPVMEQVRTEADLPRTPEEARERMRAWLASAEEPDPEYDALWMSSLEKALAEDWYGVRVQVDQILALAVPEGSG